MKKLMLVICVLVLAIFVGSSMAKNQNQYQKGDCIPDCDYDCFCGWLFDTYEAGICDCCGGCVPNGPNGNDCGYGPYGPQDEDNDGIPNGQDDDYEPPMDGTGYQYGPNRQLAIIEAIQLGK